MNMYKKRVRKTVWAITSVVIAVLVLFICMPKVSEKIAEDINIETYKKSVGQGSLVTVDGITDTGIKLTGSERTDIVNIANSQLGVVEDYSDEAEYYTIYNQWYWEFVNIKDSTGQYIYDPWGWRDATKKSAQVAKTAWCYFFLGWAADAAQCHMTVYKANTGFYVDGQVARSYVTGGDPGWYRVHERAFEIKTTKDVIENTIPGDLVVGKSSTGNGNHHIFMVSENDGTTIKTIEGNINSTHPRVVASRTLTSSNSKIWNNIELLYYYKPMYRSVATFHTNGATLLSMPEETEDEIWFDIGDKKGGDYYKYKFYDDRIYYSDKYSKYKDYTPLPDANDLFYEGHRFGGWYDNPDFSGQRYTVMPTQQIGNIDLYARWEKEIVTGTSNSTNKIDNGIKFTKKSSWTMYEGKALSDKGNPYIKIEFEVDPTEYFEENPGEDKIGTDGAAYFADKIPEEIDLAMGVYSQYERIAASDGLEIDTSLYVMDKKLFFRFTNGIENKKYNASFVVEVSKDELMAEIIAGHRKLNTNGDTANADNDGLGSSYLSAGDIYIELSSPQLVYTEVTESTDGVTTSMNIQKQVSFGMYEGSYYDELGNPYIDIEFILDLTGISSENMQKELTLVDYIPSEYEYIPDSLEVSGTPTTYLFNSAKNTVECKWSDDTFGLQGTIYYVKLKTKLNFDKVDMELINNNKGVYTNGKTIDITQRSEGSTVVNSSSFNTSLQSPIIDISSVISKVYNVKLHPNGGVIHEGKDITRYTAGKGVMLPTQMDITKDGYTFAGWYDNEALIGTVVLSIPTTATGDKEYWAKWVDQSVGGTKDGIEVSKESKWQAYNGKLADSNGNPYVKTEVTIDMTKADIDKVNNAIGKSQSTDVIIVFEQSVMMKGDPIANFVKYTKDLVDDLLKDRDNVRISIAGYAGMVSEVITLDNRNSNNATAIKAAIDTAFTKIKGYYADYDNGYYDSVVIGSNMQAGILWAQREFVDHSTADNQELIVVTKRMPTDYITNDNGSDVVKIKDNRYYTAVGKYYDYIDNQNVYTALESAYLYMSYAQMDYAREMLPNLNVTAIGLDVEDHVNALDFLANISTDYQYYNVSVKS